MKNLILVFTGLLFLAASLLSTDITHAQNEKSYRIQLDEVINRRNVLITHPETDDTYLLHLKTGCGEIETGQQVSLIINNTLNYNRDWIKIDAWHKCEIDQAEVITGKLYVDLTLSSDQSYVIDSDGKRFFISYTSFCRSIPRYWRDYIYVRQYKNELSQGDRIFLPNRDGLCSIDYVRFIPERIQEIPQEDLGDIKVPTTVSRVKASPGNGQVSLSWNASRDDSGISHYIVSYSGSRIRTRETPVSAMPNQILTESTNYTVEGLENNEKYYFYVLAVDNNGNMSSRWSIAAFTTPRASLPEVSYVRPGSFGLEVLRETSRSIIIQWNYLPGTDRQTVILEVDGKRDFARSHYTRRNIRILKRPHRIGKTLTLKVRAYDLRGLIKEEEIDFSFKD